MQNDYDAVVVGARVAGASTAMLLARQGHHVLLIDRAGMPSDTVSTHAILRTGVLQLSRWGILDRVAAAGTPAIRHMTLGFGEERVSFPMKSDFGVEALYAPRRHILDSILVDEAVISGVEFADRTRMVDIRRDSHDRVAGVTVERGGKRTDVSAGVVVGADGFRSRVAALVGARKSVDRIPANVVHYAYFDGIDLDRFWFQFTPGVNAGLIATNAGETCVFVGRPASRLADWQADPGPEFRRLLDHAGQDLAEIVAGGRKVTSFRGSAQLPTFFRRPFGPGWALVGDAGYCKDPISAHGISDAFRDAELCARAVDWSLRHPGEAAAVMAEYERVRDALSWPIFEQSLALADFGWDAEEASARMRTISATVRDECATLLSLPAWPAIRKAKSA